MLENETLTEKFVKKWFWLYFFTFLIWPIWYVVKLLLSNKLPVESVWLIYSILWLMGILSSYNDLWFTASLNYFLPKFIVEKKYNNFKTAIFISLFIQTVTAIFIAIWFYFWSTRIAINYFHSDQIIWALKIFSLYFIVFNVFRTIITVFSALQDTFWQKILDFLWYLLLLWFVLFGFSKNITSINFYSKWWFFFVLFWSILWSFVFIIKYGWLLKKWMIVFEKKMLKDYFKYSLTVLITIPAWVLLWQIDQQMILYFLSSKSAWYYTNYLSLLSISTLIIWPIIWFLVPVISEITNNKEKYKLKLILNSFYKYFSLFSIILWMFYFLFWDVISNILFWIKYGISWELLKFWWIFVWIWILFTINLSILTWMWKVKQIAKVVRFWAILNLVLNVFFIKYIWLYWAIISTIIWKTLMFLITLKIIYFYQKFRFDFSFLLKNIFWLLVCWLLFYFVKNHFFILSDDFHRFYNFVRLFVFGFFLVIFELLLNFKEIRVIKMEILWVFKKD